LFKKCEQVINLQITKMDNQKPHIDSIKLKNKVLWYLDVDPIE
jgi:hypothetical protein